MSFYTSFFFKHDISDAWTKIVKNYTLHPKTRSPEIYPWIGISPYTFVLENHEIPGKVTITVVGHFHFGISIQIFKLHHTSFCGPAMLMLSGHFRE